MEIGRFDSRLHRLAGNFISPPSRMLHRSLRSRLFVSSSLLLSLSSLLSGMLDVFREFLSIGCVGGVSDLENASWRWNFNYFRRFWTRRACLEMKMKIRALLRRPGIGRVWLLKPDSPICDACNRQISKASLGEIPVWTVRSRGL